MRSRRPTSDHQDAVARRLALLSAELAGVRPAADEPVPEPPEPPEPPAPHEEVWPPGPVAPAPPEPAYAMPPSHTRVRLPPRPQIAEQSDEAAREPAQPPPVRRPGRHASRRPGRSLAGAVPDTLQGRVALGPPQLALVAVLVALGLAVTAWWVVRSEPRQVAAPVPAREVAGLATPAVSATPSATPDEEVTVDVAGKVRRPGIVVLPAGSRVVDAIEAAGGARPGVDTSSLNLARVLVDGEQVLVGVPAPAVVPGAASGAPPAPGALVNLNTATAAELESLPEVGPVTAAAILAWRDEHGGFTAVDELLEVDGIGEATLATITPHVTV